MKVRLSKCSISEAEINAVSAVMRSEYLGMGPVVLEFERAIKKYLDTSMGVVCVNTGTSALHLALSALGLSDGDEVLVPSLTYVASFQAISATGATPISCEVNLDTLFIDCVDAEKRITDKTKAIMPVHYASSSKGMDLVYLLANKYNLRVIEDAAQAFGCYRDNEKVGQEGDIICFSFDGIKNITSAEGGAILTSDQQLLNVLSDTRLLGVQKDTEKRFSSQRSWDFEVGHQGFRYHMSNINAAIGIEQLKRIDVFRGKRQKIASQYIQSLAHIEKLTFLNINQKEIMPHIFVVKTKQRDKLRQFLLDADIECGIHYKPNHLLKKYCFSKSLPVTELAYGELISLPCHVDLSNEEQGYVINKVKDFYNA